MLQLFLKIKTLPSPTISTLPEDDCTYLLTGKSFYSTLYIMELFPPEALKRMREEYTRPCEYCNWTLPAVYIKTVEYDPVYGFLLLIERRDSG